jgi:hypothetical protein
LYLNKSGGNIIPLTNSSPFRFKPTKGSNLVFEKTESNSLLLDKASNNLTGILPNKPSTSLVETIVDIPV